MSGTFKRIFSRRDLFHRGGIIGAFAALPGVAQSAPSAPPTTAGKLQLGPDIYKSLGVRPLINCRGTFTIVSGSLELPEVRAAQEAAARHFVQLDELMDAVGRRLAEITGAESGMVSAGCAAGIAHATTACVTGGDPDLHTRVPDLTGFPKDEVIIPKHSRNEYDQAVRSVGVRVIEVGDPAEYEAALGPKVAMVYVLAGPGAENDALNYDVLYSLAKKRNIPVFTDAAAEMLSIPNVHLQRGATIVGYSGGKCLRGPQSAGIILGRKDLIKAAWVSSAPHHGHGRSMKVGKEEIMGMLAAVEIWVKRDHDAEDRMWTSWMNNIASRVSTVQGVNATVRQPRGLDNHSPGLSITWDPEKLGITGEEVAKILDTTEPRIVLAGGGGGRGRAAADNQTGVSITAYMMQPGEDKIVGDRLHQVLSEAKPKTSEPPATPATDLTGRWDVHIEFAAGSADHTFYIRQQEHKIGGAHEGDFITRDLAGSIAGDNVTIASNIGEVHGAAISYRFNGKVLGDSISGDLNMGEYLGAKWNAKRHVSGGRGQRG